MEISWFSFFTVVNLIVFFYYFLINGLYVILIFCAIAFLRRYKERLESYHLDEKIIWESAYPVSIIIPSFNEDNVCVDTVRHLRRLHYPHYELIFVNDGSSDRTVEVMKQFFHLKPVALGPIGEIKTQPVKAIYQNDSYPRITLIDKENGGKGDTVNVGINYCRHPIFCTIDSDSFLDKHALITAIRPFLLDAKTVAVGGEIRIGNDLRFVEGTVREIHLPQKILTKFQAMEYLRAFLQARSGWEYLQSTFIISGAFGLFKRATVVAAGGFTSGSTRGQNLADDMEIVIQLHHYCRDKGIPYSIHFTPGAISWTECPERIQDLRKQRSRWQQGLLQVLAQHREMVFRPRFRLLGMLVMPYLFFLEGWGPIIELTGYVVFLILLFLGVAPTYYIIAFIAIAVITGAALSIATVVLHEITLKRYKRLRDFIQLVLLATCEYVGYRQFMQFCRIQGMFQHIKGHHEWEKKKRQGLD